MTRKHLLGAALTAAVLTAGSPVAVLGQPPEPTTITWSGESIGGAALVVPAEDRPAVVLFAMANQPRSIEAMQQLMGVLGEAPEVAVFAVVSGERAAEEARALADTAGWPWPMAADPRYAASGAMSVRVWPTTVIVTPTGTQVAHIGGLPASFAQDVEDYLAHAAGRIDARTLAKRLAEHGVVESTPQHIAGRHLEVAERLIDRRQFDQARRELERGLELAPGEARLTLALARLEILTGDAAAALGRLDGLEPGALVAWRVKSLRGWALVALGQWERAGEVLTEALVLNPDPVETYYLLGRCHEHAGDWAEAAQAYRRAFEHSPAGRRLEPHADAQP